MIIDDVLDKGLSDIHFGNEDKVLCDFKFWYCYWLTCLRYCGVKSSNEFHDKVINRIIRYVVDIKVEKVDSFSDTLSQTFECEYIIITDETPIRYKGTYPETPQQAAKSTISQSITIQFEFSGLVSFIGNHGSRTITIETSDLRSSLERFKLLNI